MSLSLRGQTAPPMTLLACGLAGTIAFVFGLTGGDHLGRGLAITLAFAAWLFGIISAFRGIHRPFALPFGYLALLGVFHLPGAPLTMLGFHKPFTDRWFRSDWLVPALCLVAVSCTAFAFGVEIARQWSVRRARGLAFESDRGTAVGSNVVLWEAGLTLWVFSLALLLVGAYQLNLFSGRYIDYWESTGTADTRLFITGLQFVVIASVVTSTGAAPRFIPYCMAGFFVSTLPLALFGFRGPMVVYLIAMLPTWYRKRPRLTRRLGAVAGVAVVLGSPVIALIRTGEDESRDLMAEATPVAFLLETGNTMMPLIETVRLVDSNATRFWHGSSYVEALSRVLPNLGTEQRSSGEIIDTAPAHWLVANVAPWAVGRGSGFGFSGVAEPFLNFGILGVLLYFLVLGFVLEIADRWVAGNPFTASFILCAYGTLLWTIRNDFTNFARPTAWSALIIGGAFLVDNHIVRSHREPVEVVAAQAPRRRWGTKSG